MGSLHSLEWIITRSGTTFAANKAIINVTFLICVSHWYEEHPTGPHGTLEHSSQFGGKCCDWECTQDCLVRQFSLRRIQEEGAALWY